MIFALGSVAFAQDDDLPPPSSKPKVEDGQSHPDDEFKGFKTKKKIDFSKFIIEPNVNFSIGQDYIILGLSPYVGYRVWKPANAKPAMGNTGLFVGGGYTYLYNGYKNLAFTDGVNTYYANANWHTMGGGAFVQYNVWRGFFARVKFEILHRKLDDYRGAYLSSSGSGRPQVKLPVIEKTMPSMLIGAGYNLLQSKNFFFPIMISYNVLHSVTDPYYSIYPRGLVVQLGFINVF